MSLSRIWLTDFRCYESAEVALAPGLTALVGDNGQGKTNVLEALGWLATMASFRGAPAEALVRVGAERAVVRAEGTTGGRPLLVEAEIVPGGRHRVQVNRQPLRRSRDLLGTLRVTVFAPDDLELVKGGPSERRRFLDDALVALRPRDDALRTEVDRVLRQRNALLKQVASGRGGDRSSIESTLDVWDTRLATSGAALVEARLALLARLEDRLGDLYRVLSGAPVPSAAPVRARYLPVQGEVPLADALAAARADDLRRGVTTVGPHRDDLELRIGDLPARTHASQGEQRSLALALRLATHHVVAEAVDEPPVLLLDDVFSELDPTRSAALLAHLPASQTVLTSAAGLPAGTSPDAVWQVRGGRIEPAG